MKGLFNGVKNDGPFYGKALQFRETKSKAKPETRRERRTKIRGNGGILNAFLIKIKEHRYPQRYRYCDIII